MLRLLTRYDSALIQPVFDACVDYATLQDGQPFARDAAQLEFDEVPLGFSTDAKRVFAIEPSSSPPIGIIEGLRGYPSPDVWFVGLMLVVPAARSAGLGTAAVGELERYVRAMDGCSEIELAVLKSNEPGLRFWERKGFSIRREAPAAVFGQRIHERFVMGKRVCDA